MNSFAQIWQSSRNNFWSALYPYVVIVGVLTLVCLSFVKPTIKRRSLKLLSAFMFVGLATVASSFEISEKWRIRHEWSSAHWTELTQEQQRASISDGGNILFGPVILGFEAFIIFVGVLLVISIGTRLLQRGNSLSVLKQQEENERGSAADLDSCRLPCEK